MSDDSKFVKAAREHLFGPNTPTASSTSAFAEALGVKRHTIWRLERGDPLSKTTRLAIEKLLIEHERKTKRSKRASKRAL
jgi:hypothetical protein